MSFLKLNSRGNLALILVAFLAITLLAPIQLVSKVQAPAGDPWWNTDWQYRKKITIDYTKVATALTDFPVLISLTDSDLASKAQANGYDIAFTDNLASKLDHEIEFYNSGSAKLVAWVRVPTLSSTANTILYMYYGNPGATNQQNVAGTWNSNYAMVTHLKEATGTLHDSTSYNIDGTPYNGVSQNITGKLNGAASFDGSNDYVDCGTNALNFGTGSFTISMWLSGPAQAQDFTGILKRLDTGAPPNDEYTYTLRCGGAYTGSNKAALQFAIYNKTTTVWKYVDISNVLNSQWRYVVALRDGDTLRVYIDGAPAGSTTGAGSINTNTPNQLLIGKHKATYYNGKLDEVRMSNVARSASWISTEYTNQNSPSTFYSIGGEETPQGPPAASDPSPANGAVDVPISLSELSFDLFDAQDDLMNYEVTTSPNIGSDSDTGVGNGRYDVSISGLQRNTIYTWRVCAKDPTGSGQWNNVTYSFKTWVGPTGSCWLPGWQYRKSHVITSATGAGTGYQTMVKVSYSTQPPASWFTVLPTNIPVFVSNDVSSNGTIFAGDSSYNIYKSINNGTTFTKIFTIPTQSPNWGLMAGRVWTTFVDSRNYVFVSAGGTNRLYRSTNYGTSFSEVLNLPDRTTYADAHIISMTEDAGGNLYAAEYADTMPPGGARLWNSTDSGATWLSVSKTWSARHLHDVKYNPYNGWLYVVVGENSDGSQTEYQTVWRSKDLGDTWACVVAWGPDIYATKYVPMEFMGRDVYLGQDHQGGSETNLIQRITDDGVSEPFTPVTVYNNPHKAAIMISATKLGNTMIFSTCSESYDPATCQVVMSNDGSTWTILNAQVVSTTYKYINRLTVHPRTGFVYGCINYNYAYFIASPSTPRPPSLQPPLSAETVLAEGHCKTDFGDIRFTDDDGTTPLDYWMETKVDGEYATFWVQVTDDLGSASRTIYVYYGRIDATTASNPDNTFLFFDDFSGTMDKWTILSGAWATGGGNLTIQPATGVRNNYLITQSSFATSNIAIRTRIASTQVPPPSGDPQAHPGIIWHANTQTGTSHRNDQVYFRPHNTGPTGYGNIQPAYYDGIDGIEGSGLHFYDDKKGSYYNWNTWSTVEVRIPSSPTNLTLYGNNLYWHNWGNQQFANDRIGLVAQEGGKNYFDYFAVRKYVDPEPAHSSWGSEETLTIDSCNSIGTKKNDFIAGDEIWVNGSKGYSPSTLYPIYVVTDIDWDNDDPIPTRVPGTVKNVTSNPDGSILAKVWASASPGEYDIVIDFDGDGVYDEGLDPLDNNQVVGTAGFFVIPEYTLGTILALVVCFASVGAYRRIKRSKR